MNTKTICLSGINEPKFPPPNYIEEGNMHFCVCGSTREMRFLLFPTRKCHQPNCVHYYKGFPSEDYNENYASYVDGRWDMYYRMG